MNWTSRTKVRKHGLLLDAPVDDDGRCLTCGGACCSAFPSVELTWDEFQRLMELGARRLEFSLTGHPQLMIENGCEFLASGRCAIYADRPDVCRRFFCRDL